MGSVLRYTKKKVSNSTVRRHYDKWRAAQVPAIPQRCDITGCAFFAGPLVWNGVRVPLILDHIDGTNSDNRPKMLRLVCGLCNTQQQTNGGGNKGRVDKSTGGFAIKEKNGRKRYTLVAELPADLFDRPADK